MWRDDLMQLVQIMRAAADNVPEKPHPLYIGSGAGNLLYYAFCVERLAQAGAEERQGPSERCPECGCVYSTEEPPEWVKASSYGRLSFEYHSSNCSRLKLKEST